MYSYPAIFSALARLRLYLLAIATSIAFSAPAHAQETQIPVPEIRESFVVRLQTAIRADDARQIARLIKYPARYNSGKTSGIIRNPAAFVANYRKFIAADLRAAVLAQDPKKIFQNWQGIMIGGGSQNIWAREVDEAGKTRYLIVTFNN